VTLDLVYELLYAGNLLPTEVTREVDDVPSRLLNNAIAHKVTKVVALLEVVPDLPRTPRNRAAVLHPRINADSLLSEVETALKKLEEAQIVRESEEGFKLLTIQEKNWDTTRRGLDPKPAERNRIKREWLQEIFADPSLRGYRYQNRKAFPFSLAIDGEVAEIRGKSHWRSAPPMTPKILQQPARKRAAPVTKNVMSCSGYAPWLRKCTSTSRNSIAAAT
jgi:hypothetical protein